MAKELKTPFLGNYTDPEKCKSVTSQGENFMWHAMAGYQWHHQTLRDMNKTMYELRELINMKIELQEGLCMQIDEFDWTHMYSDDSRPSRQQAERNKQFNQDLMLAPADIKFEVYKHFISRYLDWSPQAYAPISFETFKNGISV
jgi:hypothetical protein